MDHCAITLLHNRIQRSSYLSDTAAGLLRYSDSLSQGEELHSEGSKLGRASFALLEYEAPLALTRSHVSFALQCLTLNRWRPPESHSDSLLPPQAINRKMMEIFPMANATCSVTFKLIPQVQNQPVRSLFAMSNLYSQHIPRFCNKSAADKTSCFSDLIPSNSDSFKS